MTASDTEARRRGGDEQTPASPRFSASESGGESPTPERVSPAPPRSARLSARAASRLSQLLVGKSLVEAVFVAALVAAFSYTHFNPYFRGTLDVADERRVAGWVVDESKPDSQVEVELYIDGHFVARRRADKPRIDLVAAGRAARPEHGFSFETPPLPPRDAEYEARVYAYHAGDPARPTLQQIDRPVRFKALSGANNEGTPADWWDGAGKR